MEPTLNIIFNLDKNKEIITYKKMIKTGNNYYSQYLMKPQEKPIGTFLINFLNTDFNKKENVTNFIKEYCFEHYYSLINKKYKDKYINYTFTISENEYLEYLDKIFKKYGEDVLWVYDEFWNIAIKRYRHLHLYENFKFKDSDFSNYNKNKLDTLIPSDYFEDLNDTDLKESIGEIVIDFNFSNYHNLNISSNIPCAYKSRTYESILYLTFRQIASSKYLICKCENCGKFFIPFSNHDTKYCNNIFKNNKTCKDLAPEIAYKQKINKDPLLKKYRTRYQSLQKAATLNPEKNMKKYENYKKVGAIKKNEYLTNQITAKEFENWINSTKLKK